MFVEGGTVAGREEEGFPAEKITTDGAGAAIVFVNIGRRARDYTRYTSTDLWTVVALFGCSECISWGVAISQCSIF